MVIQCSDVSNRHDHDYGEFLAMANMRFAQAEGPLFTTDAEALWGLYLSSFENPVVRQHHNCKACRHFIERFGGLAVIDAEGNVESAIWNKDGAPAEYEPAIAAMARAVRRARVTGVFLSSEKVLGTPKTGVWRHLALDMPADKVFRSRLLSAYQAMAEKREDFKQVKRALIEYPSGLQDQALLLLRSGILSRSYKVLPQAEWLHSLAYAAYQKSGCNRNNVIWRAVATAPAGFCHPRSGVLGTLLDDIAAGKGFDEITGAFKAKMNPIGYQRPQAAPTNWTGGIK